MMKGYSRNGQTYHLVVYMTSKLQTFNIKIYSIHFVGDEGQVGEDCKENPS